MNVHQYQLLHKCYNRITCIAKMSRRTPNPAKVLIREQVAEKIAALSAEEKKRQSKIVYDKARGLDNVGSPRSKGRAPVRLIATPGKRHAPIVHLQNLYLEIFSDMINHPYYISAQRISLFMSTDQEIDTAPMIAHIKAKGSSAFVPQYAGGKMKMLKLEAGDEDNMPLTRHGIAQHSKDQQREDALDQGLDLIIAPGVAFTRDGGRIGHGGGYYDKYIASLRENPDAAPKILAIAFNCQVLEEVPMDELDQRINGVIFAED